MSEPTPARRGLRTLLARPPAPSDGAGGFSTTVGGVDWILAVVVVALRIVNLLQLTAAVVGTYDRSMNAPLGFVVAGGYATWSIVLISVALRTRQVRRPWMVGTDITIAILVQLSMLFVRPPGVPLNTWDSWGGAITYPCAFYAGFGPRKRRWVIVGSAALMIGYVTPTLLADPDPTDLFTAWTNALAFPGYTAIGYIVVRFVLRVAADADAARQEAVHAAAEAENARHRALLHDHATILELVARGTDDPDLTRVLRRQAAMGARRVEAFMGKSEEAPGSAPNDLQELVHGVGDDFADLRPVVTADLAAGTVLDARVAGAVQGALTTLLHNVRRHAQAGHVVVHADARDDGWEVVVRDDGVGFDPASTPGGYGLGQQVKGACAAVGVDVALTSAPGEGTTVVLSGRTKSRDDEGAARRRNGEQ